MEDKTDMGGVMQKVPWCPEPLSYQKKGGRVTRPSFFWYDTDLEKNVKKKNQKFPKKKFFQQEKI